MDKIDEMNIKIQNTGVGHNSDSKGSSRSLADYLNHEDEERIAQGKEPIPFLNPDGQMLTTEEVVKAIDGNAKGLCAKDDKYYHMVVSPSASEIDAMGADEQERYSNAIILMRAILNAYAKSFNREGVEDASNLVAAWRAHFTRGKEDEGQFHIHVILSRKSKEDSAGKSHKLSPMTNHRDTDKGPVKGGFDRKDFFKKCEAIFDNLFLYERTVAETFDYRNAMAHGSSEERAEQAALLAEEQREDLEKTLSDAFARRRNRIKEQNEEEELAEALRDENPELTGNNIETLEQAIKMADRNNDIYYSLVKATSLKALNLQLMKQGVLVEAVKDIKGCVKDLKINIKGLDTLASSEYTAEQFKRILLKWKTLTGQEPSFMMEAREERIKQEKLKKQIEEEQTQGISRGLHF